MIRVDLHVHTAYSVDSTISPRHLVNQLYAHPTVKGVAVTDHDTLEGYFSVKKLAAAYDDLIVIPGIEVSTTHGHIIILGVEHVPPWLDKVEEVVEFAKENGGVIVIPHPYRVMGLGDLAGEIGADVIEVLNARATRLENRYAEQLACARKLPGVAGTDAHSPEDLWRVCTEVDCGLSVEEALEAIRKGRLRVGVV